MPASPLFVRQVRHALAHLYDPEVLRAHPLLDSFSLAGRANPQAALRETLLAEIEALKPAPTTPIDSRTWRIYRVLHCRYVQQMDQEQTAHQLGVTVRHVRREQRAAVQALADVLCQKHPSGPPAPPAASSIRIEEELSWLTGAGQGEPATVGDALQGALGLLTPLAAARHTRLESPPLLRLPQVAIHPAALRQALVSAIGCAVRRVPAGTVHFQAEQRDGQVRLTIAATAPGVLPAPAGDEAASLDAARALLGLDSGRIECTEETASLTLTLILPVAGMLDVLLVDDNADFAQLFERYLAGSRYRLRCLSNAEQLFDTVRAHPPQVIVLDVMMPGVDGWEVLARLRQHPLTSGTAVVVCTILPERELARSLGATGFLPKPVRREGLLAALSDALELTRSGGSS